MDFEKNINRLTNKQKFVIFKKYLNWSFLTHPQPAQGRFVLIPTTEQIAINVFNRKISKLELKILTEMDCKRILK